jgi:UDP-GlcNAc3NAcA epimerase
MKFCSIVGARPQFIKAAVVSREILRRGDLSEQIIHTGQHYDANMSDIFFAELDIPKPHYNLGIGGGTHGQNTGRMIEQIEQVLIKEKPDGVLVYGDTDSTLAAAIAASKLHIPIAHVEAGLRSYNRRMPEEINRILTDHTSEILFTPTKIATDNLIKEGIDLNKITQSGDVMRDAALYYKNKAQAIKTKIPNEFILCTIHRAENTDDIQRLERICSELNKIGGQIPVVFPIHPRTLKMMTATQSDLSHLILLEPVSYLEMVWLLDHCKLVITDSGGLQKEAYFFEKPCVTVRNETEWVELVEQGVNCLTAPEDMGQAVAQMMNKSIASGANLYGDGQAGLKVVERLFALRL